MKGQFFPYGDSAKTKRFPVVTVSLILTNAAIFAWSLADFENVINTFGFTPYYFPSLYALITIFTSMFLHAGLDHIFGNMWYLWIFGDNVEDRVGRLKFFVLYLLSGTAASIVQYLVDTSSGIPSIGASGAVSGILGSYLVFFPKSRITTSMGYWLSESPAWFVIGFWFLMQLFFGFATLAGYSGSNIAFFAHIGGFAFGYAAAKATRKSR
ncbi:MAG: rhomboid family intramembrane serine protease [Candidatus Aenigmarchaeota archaeon]|nr:rhomboid family intramembrane serine protease [Candidatus Aenigmarchaeota archaeon]